MSSAGLTVLWCVLGLPQVSRLQKNVDDLQHALLKSLHDRQPTVIYAGQGKSGWVSVLT
jgi:hypothetical protein